MLENLKAFILEEKAAHLANKAGTLSDVGTDEQKWNNGYETGYVSALELLLIAINDPFYSVTSPVAAKPLPDREPHTITPGPKTSFDVEILLSENQLKLLCEDAGDDTYTCLDLYNDLSVDKYDEMLKPNPSFEMGFGADINDILSMGFFFYSHIRTDLATKIQLEDVRLHPFRIALHMIKSIETYVQPINIESGYEPITFAVDPDGQLVTAEEVANGLAGTDNDLPF